MNRTLLLFIVDFLFLNLIALTRWERAEPARPRQPPVNAISANTVSKDQDLVEAMRQSLADEQLSRQALEQKLSTADSTLSTRERSLGQLQSESLKLTAQLVDTQKSQADLNIKYQAEAQEATLTRSQLAQLQRELEDARAESERRSQALAALEKQKADALKQIEGLTVAVAVGEREKVQLAEKASELQEQVQSEQGDPRQPPHQHERPLQRLPGEPRGDGVLGEPEGPFWKHHPRPGDEDRVHDGWKARVRPPGG